MSLNKKILRNRTLILNLNEFLRDAKSKEGYNFIKLTVSRLSPKQYLLYSFLYITIVEYYNFQMEIITLLIITFFYTVSYESFLMPSRNSSFTLAYNQVVNSQISTPNLTASNISGWYDYPTYQSGWATAQYFLEYVDICVYQSKVSISCTNFIGITCGQQFLNTDSNNTNQKYYQLFNLEGGDQYQMSFDWITQSSLYPTSTGIAVLWNGIVIDSFYSTSCTLTSSTYYLISINQSNKLMFKGIGTADGNGILIRNVKLQKLTYLNLTNSNQSQASGGHIILNQKNNYSTFNDVQKKFNSSQAEYSNIMALFRFFDSNLLIQIASNSASLKQSVKAILGYMLQFNHFILYTNHLTNYTVTSDVILICMQLMDDQKGHLLDLYIYPFFNSSPEQINSDFKQQNTMPDNIFNADSAFNFRPNGFLLDFADTILMSIPLTLFIFILSNFFFKRLFNYRISLFFRQYSIFGVFFYVILDGKLEILTFQFLSEILLLTNSSFQQKMKTFLIIFVYFSCFIFAIGSMILYRWLYRQVLKYVYENCKQPLQSTLYMTLSYGFYNIILGTLHRVLLYYPLPQLYILIAFETIYLIYITFLLCSNFYHNKFIGLSLCLMNASRLAFIVTLLAYELDAGRQQGISYAQTLIFYLFIALWGLTAFLCFMEKVGILIKVIIAECQERNRNKIVPYEKIEESMVNKYGMHKHVFVLTKDKNNKTRIRQQQYYNHQSKISKLIQVQLQKDKNNQFEDPENKIIKQVTFNKKKQLRYK